MAEIRFEIQLEADKLMTNLGLDVTPEYCFELLRDALRENGLKTFNMSVNCSEGIEAY